MSTTKVELKKCSACKRALPLSDFPKSNTISCGRRAQCKKCYNQKKRLWRSSNYEKRKEYDTVYRERPAVKIRRREVSRKYSLMTRFGITIELYDSMYISQGGRCAICGTHQSEFNKRLAVDHCHDTGKVRGLLCDNCNQGIAKFDDNTYLLLNAVNYLGDDK